jgi:hypothetical protein
MDISAVGIEFVRTGVLIVLFGDRFVHRLVGRKSLEARVGDIESALKTANETSSRKMGEITKEMDTARQARENLAREVSEIHGRLDALTGGWRR